MELYDVKTRGLHSPLNSREISVLFRTGRFDTQTKCKPVGEGQWRTIDELFPLLKYESGRVYEMRKISGRGPGRARVAGAIVALTFVAGVLFRSQQAPPKSTPPAEAASEPAASLPVASTFAPAPPRYSATEIEASFPRNSDPRATARTGVVATAAR